jgi:hypothetical protein
MARVICFVLAAALFPFGTLAPKAPLAHLGLAGRVVRDPAMDPLVVVGQRGPDGLFSAAKWEPLDSGLLGPVGITPLRITRP